MDTKEIEAAKRMKNTVWSPGLKEYYEPEDVLRYYSERAIQLEQSHHSRRYNCDPIQVFGPETFFTKQVLKEGLRLQKEKVIDTLKNDIAYLEEVKLPDLKKRLEKILSNE